MLKSEWIILPLSTEPVISSKKATGLFRVICPHSKSMLAGSNHLLALQMPPSKRIFTLISLGTKRSLTDLLTCSSLFLIFFFFFFLIVGGFFFQSLHISQLPLLSTMTEEILTLILVNVILETSVLSGGSYFMGLWTSNYSYLGMKIPIVINMCILMRNKRFGFT